MTFKIGLLGAGRMGKVYARTLAFLSTDVTLAAVADPDARAVDALAAQYRIPGRYSDYRKLLDEAGVDAVVVATPTDTHAEVVCAAADAGKHIFSEKPLAQTLTGCDDAIAAAKRAGVKLQVGFMRRFDPAYVLAKARIDAGEIGKPVIFKGVGRDPGAPSLQFARRESSGGLIMDMGIHDFDMMRWLMGSEVEQVYSEGGCLVFPDLATVGDIDNAVVSIKFASGALGSIDVSRNAVYGYDIRTEVLGSEGGLQIGKLQQTATLTLTRAGVTHDTVPFFMERFAEAYAAEIQDFVRNVVEDRPSSVTGEDARAATAIGIAATLSLDEGRVVKVSEVEQVG